MIDLLVVNYNTPDLLRRFLDTLHSDYEPDVYNVYIADNGSTDGLSHKIISSLQDSKSWGDIKLAGVFQNENIGYSAAINKMAAISSGDILCAINADTAFTTTHVKQVQESFDSTPDMAICGVKQMDEQQRIRHGGIFWDGVSNPMHRGWNEHDPLDFKYKDKIRCWTVSGSIYYVRRNIWNELLSCPIFCDLFPEAEGAFLPTPHFFEETFCSVHAQHHGYQVWYDGTVETAIHTWHASSDVGDASRKYFDISRQIYIHACNAEGIVHECN